MYINILLRRNVYIFFGGKGWKRLYCSPSGRLTGRMIWQRHLQQTYLALQVAKHRKHDAREFKLAFRHNIKTFDMLCEQPIASTERQAFD